MPFVAPFPIRSEQDIQRLEQTPLAQAVDCASTYELICRSVQTRGDRTALTFLHSGRPEDAPTRWTYRTLLDGIHQTANLLHGLGMGHQDVVAVMLPGGLAYHLALWGGEAAGIVQPLNPMLSDDKLLALLRASGARVLMAHGEDDDSGMLAKALRLKAQLPELSTLLLVTPDGQPLRMATPLPEGVLDFHVLRATQPADRLLSQRRFAPTDIAAYFHTGGTTGAPKLARHSHAAQVFTAWANARMQGMRPDDVLINGYPLFHVAGVLPGALCSLAVGMETIIPTASLFRNREVIQNYWRLVEKYRSTLVSGVPTALAALAAVPLNGADISSVRSVRTGASPLPAELAARFQRQFGLPVNESLGMTEMAGLSTVAPAGVEAPAGCVGWRLPYTQIRVVALDANGIPTEEDLGAGESGMVLFKSPNLFSGYLDEAETANAFTPDGWLISGDLGWRDAQGRLHLSGRAKDLIIRGGHNIDPKVIEDALGAHPAVHLCAAVGAPDAYAGELPVAFATLLPGATATEAELLEFTAARVDEAPARPKSITILQHMPVTNVGKIYKPELRTLATAAVVQAFVDKVCNELALATGARPEVQATADAPVRVLLDAQRQGTQLVSLEERLLPLLAALPVKVQVENA
ncbi:acyl-CoA synthetase [Rhodoferax sp. UBA5149]|uniref:acyl-CoA synthetase n=1 Tax=Rhodoferax sp. UBA5149 TaxID=1947379 RepID=UPI0025D4CB6C|nr:acyl-CoA synthetase [Rhodoferax sp. UBA5149]